MVQRGIFAGIAALLALAVLSCPDTPVEEDNPTRYTPDGRPLVLLTIGTDDTRRDQSLSSRALNDTLARAGINFYEVAFYDGTAYYRTSWTRGQSGRLFVPAFDYAGSGHAILFAGSQHENNLTLLALGLLASVDGTPGAVITLTTRSVEFSIVPLLSDVKADPASSFSITGPLGYETVDVLNRLPAFPVFPLSATNPGRQVPLFLIPADSLGIEASFALTLPDGMQFSSYQNGIFAAGSGAVANRIPDGSPPLLVLPFNVYGELDITVKSPVSGSHFTGNLITFAISTEITTIPAGPQDFYSKISFQVPVNAIKNEVSDDGTRPLTWYIRGGLQNDQYDEGTAINSLGGAIVLGIGDVDYNLLP